MGQHEHDWQPLEQWAGRYRCPGCAAFGYRKSVQGYGMGAEKASQIVPYRCQVRHCGLPAICKTEPDWRGNRKWRCAVHRDGGEARYRGR